ncbi:retrovirus-related pol polyprotein from transposon TNT 1-94 [Tanacetum coccineum]
MSSKFQMSMMGQMLFFLGLQVSQSPGGIFINQAKYALETLKKYGMDLSDPVDTPMVDRLKLDEDLMGFTLPKSTLKLSNVSFRLLNRNITWVFGIEDNAMVTTAYADADHAAMSDSRRKSVRKCSVSGDRFVSWSSKKHRSTQDQFMRLNTSPYDAGPNVPPQPPTRTELMADCTSLSVVNNREKQPTFQCTKDSKEPHLSDISGHPESQRGLVPFLAANTMAEQNVPAQAPARTDEQIVPRSQWLQIGKSNLLFDAQKIQKNPIFQISVDILRNTNFFRAFSASASVPAVYIQQFWNSMKYDEKTGVYSCQVDEQWFNLSADLLRKALDITPVDPAHPFELPPTGDTVIDFVNQLGYPEPVEFVSNIRVNYVYQPWRAILTMINQCLTGKTSGSDKPRHPVLQMLWGIVTQTNVDHAELLWEEFTQGIQTFFSHKASHEASLKDPKKKAVPLLIPYGRFTKMIIYYLGSTSDVHKRPESPCHLPGDDFLLGNLKFISKGETNEVFGMTIPKQLITQAIQQSLYYPKYLEMVAKNTKKTPQDSASKQPEPATKRAPPKKPTTATPVKPTKTPSSKQPKSPTKKPSKRKLPQKVRKGKPSFQLVDEDDEAQQESVPQEEGDDHDLELAKKMSLDAHQEKGEGEGDDADIERAIKLSLDPSFLPQGRAPVGGVTIKDLVSETTPKLPEVVGKCKAIVTEEQVAHSLIDLSKKKRTTDQFILVRRDQAPHDSTTGPSSQPEDDTSEKVIHKSSSTSDSERTESETEVAAPKGDKDQGEVDSSTVTS